MVTNETHHCIFCDQRKAIYYCEDCNLSFCEDCGYTEKRTIYECAQCKSPNVECRQRNSVNGELYICKDCGSLDIEAKPSIQRSCPGCRSSSIVPISKKRLVLIRNLKDVVNGFKLGYQELKVFLRDFRSIRQRTLALRAVGYLHDPVIENTLLQVNETIKAVSKEILDRATQEIDLFRIQMEKFYNFSKWTAADFPEIELIIKQIHEDVLNYQAYIQKIFAHPKSELNLVQSKLNVIRYYKSIYDEFIQYLNLFPGELPVCAFKDIKFAKSTIQGLRKGKGILFLTDQRLIFIKKSGIIRKKTQRIFNFSFNHILDVTLNGRIFKKLLFILDQGNLIFSAQKRMMDAILDYLNISVNFGKYRINDGKILNTLDQLQLSTKHLEKQIDKRIVQLVAGAPEALNLESISPISFTTEVGNNIPVVNTNRMIIKFQTEKFSIEQTIQNLEDKFKTGGIGAETYIRNFRNLQSELYIIDKKIFELEKNNYEDLQL